jgi:hypothetical protein
MTKTGKILVVLNLALSVCMASWAFGVWSNRIDFSDTKATAEQPGGEFAQRAVQIDALWATVPPAEQAWKTARADLLERESRRLADRGWFEDELSHIRTKADPKDRDHPCRTVKYAAANDDPPGARKGEVVLDPATDRPALENANDRAGNRLWSLRYYAEKEQGILRDMEAAQKDHEKQIKEAVALTERIVGTKEPTKTKGLQQRLLDERKKRDDVVAEEELIQPQLINAVVESELILKRRKALELRIEELNKIGVALQKR